ncbi:type II toxin-antitoxin system Phd/YefM family antitoxin [Candidatus Roizmanbacteria bacterium]|nr:type II toxin-antitoxin system Phd/YefM family antitoxin [Candidatus Roizmanbacteria bacterium]
MNNLISISDVRANLPELVTQVSNTMGRVIITVNGQPKATLVSAEELESLEETAEILTIPGVKESILRGFKQAKKNKGILLSELT